MSAPKLRIGECELGDGNDCITWKVCLWHCYNTGEYSKDGVCEDCSEECLSCNAVPSCKECRYEYRRALNLGSGPSINQGINDCSTGLISPRSLPNCISLVERDDEEDLDMTFYLAPYNSATPGNTTSLGAKYTPPFGATPESITLPTGFEVFDDFNSIAFLVSLVLPAHTFKYLCRYRL